MPAKLNKRLTISRYDLLPERVRKREIKLARYTLLPFGLAADTVGDVTLDARIALIQQHPDSDLYLCPLVPNPQPEISAAWFYADCIAFDHDIPVIVYPTRADIRRFGFRYIYSGTHKPQPITSHNVDTGETSIHYRRSMSTEALAKHYFNEQLCTIISEIREFHHGPMTFIKFRHSGWDKQRNLEYQRIYGPASQAIHLYATALRQADTLSEYLSYYRILENITNSNGVNWLRDALARLSQHRFDVIEIGIWDERETRNLMQIFRRRALQRLKALLVTHGAPSSVADYLYQVNRCGIAHGRRIVRGDITPSYFEMVRDTYLIKQLARMAIDERLGNSRL